MDEQCILGCTLSLMLPCFVFFQHTKRFLSSQQPFDKSTPPKASRLLLYTNWPCVRYQKREKRFKGIQHALLETPTRCHLLLLPPVSTKRHRQDAAGTKPFLSIGMTPKEEPCGAWACFLEHCSSKTSTGSGT